MMPSSFCIAEVGFLKKSTRLISLTLLFSIYGTLSFSQNLELLSISDECELLDGDLSPFHYACSETKFGDLGYFDTNHTYFAVDFFRRDFDLEDLSSTPVEQIGLNAIGSLRNDPTLNQNYTINFFQISDTRYYEGNYLYVISQTEYQIFKKDEPSEQDGTRVNLISLPETTLTMISNFGVEIEIAYIGTIESNLNELKQMIETLDAQVLYREQSGVSP